MFFLCSVHFSLIPGLRSEVTSAQMPRGPSSGGFLPRTQSLLSLCSCLLFVLQDIDLQPV